MSTVVPEVNNDNMRYLYCSQVTRNDETLTLRGVDEESVRYQEILQSVKTPRVDTGGNVIVEHGLLNPIVVRPVVGRPGIYAIVDGLHRLTAWQEAFGQTKPIPSIIVNLDDEAVLTAQLQANVLSAKTSQSELGNQCVKILDRHPEWSLETLATLLGCESNSIRSWMSLTRLPEELQKAIDNGSLPASVGFVLARFNGKKDQKSFWATKQKEWVDHYEKLRNEPRGLEQWMGEAAVGLKAAKNEVKLKGNLAETGVGAPSTVNPTPVFRKKQEVEIEIKRAQEHLETFTSSDKANAKDFYTMYPKAAELIGAFKYVEGLQWTVSMDPTTVESRKHDMEERAASRNNALEEKKAGKKAESIARATGLFGLFAKR